MHLALVKYHYLFVLSAALVNFNASVSIAAYVAESMHPIHIDTECSLGFQVLIGILFPGIVTRCCPLVILLWLFVTVLVS